jgi:DNA-binding response OmpR family regulator
MSTILLVEHDSGARQAITDILTASGYDVVSVAGREEGLLPLPDADLLILDMDGPYENTLAAFDQIRAARPDIPVVATAAATWRGWETLSAAMRLGADDFLTKPFEEDEVSQTVQGALARGRLMAGEATAE